MPSPLAHVKFSDLGKVATGPVDLVIDPGRLTPWVVVTCLVLNRDIVSLGVMEEATTNAGQVLTGLVCGLRLQGTNGQPAPVLSVERNQRIEVLVLGNALASLIAPAKDNPYGGREVSIGLASVSRTGVKRDGAPLRLKVSTRQPQLPTIPVRLSRHGRTLDAARDFVELEIPADQSQGSSNGLEIVTLTPLLRELGEGSLAGIDELRRLITVRGNGPLSVPIMAALQIETGEHSIDEAEAVPPQALEWHFPKADDVLETTAPEAQTLAISLERFVGALQQMGQHETGPSEGYAGDITIRTTIEAEGYPPQETLTKLRYRLRYDFSPTVFLEIPDAAESLPLFEKHDAGRTATSEVSLRMSGLDALSPLVNENAEVPLMLRLRIDGWDADETVELSYACPDPAQPGDPQWMVRGTYRLASCSSPGRHPNDATAQSVARVTVMVPLPPAAQSAARHSVLVRVRRLENPLGRPEAIDHITVPVQFQSRRNGHVICIDWGTSSVAAGFSHVADPQTIPLPLGRVLRSILGVGDKGSVRKKRKLTVLDDESDELISSNVGVDPALNFRALRRPLSVFDAKQDFQDSDAVRRRLTALRRTYDIGLPPRPHGGDLAEYRGQIIDSLKMLLTKDGTSRLLGKQVPFRKADGEFGTTDRIEVEPLVLDCLDELVGFYIAESVRLLETSKEGGDPDMGNRIRSGLLDDDLRLVLTHPCGIHRRLVSRYRRLGHEIMKRLDRGHLPAWDEAGLGEAAQTAADEAVVTVPESLAAAFYVLNHEKYRETFAADPKDEVTAHPRRVFAFDLGAGTFDLSVIDCTYLRRKLVGWKVRSHFGINLGGRDIDDKLFELIDALIEELGRKTHGFERIYPIQSPRQEMLDDTHGHREAMKSFAAAFERSKRELTAHLLGLSEEGAAYEWPRDLRWRIVVSKFGGQPWPIRVKSFTEGELARLASGRIRLVGEAFDLDDHSGLKEERLVLEIANIFDADGVQSLSVFEPVRKALDDLNRMIGLIATRLPVACNNWLTAREPMAAPVNGRLRPRFCIITGRAALWPPAYMAFCRFAASIQASTIPDRRPFEPIVMKQAVMAGALQLARAPVFLDPASAPPDAPIAIRFPSQTMADRSDPGEFVDTDRHRSPDTALAITGQAFQIARVVPGIAEITDPLDHELVRLWEDIRRRAIDPVDLTSGRAPPRGLWFEFEYADDGSERVEAIILRTDEGGNPRGEKFRVDEGAAFFL